MLSDEETARYEELRAIVARLRAPDGCPWDREQTHAACVPTCIEEAYEVLHRSTPATPSTAGGARRPALPGPPAHPAGRRSRRVR